MIFQEDLSNLSYLTHKPQPNKKKEDDTMSDLNTTEQQNPEEKTLEEAIEAANEEAGEPDADDDGEDEEENDLPAADEGDDDLPAPCGGAASCGG